MYKEAIKPIFDILAALIGLLLLSPIFLMVTMALFFANNGKPFFFQKRPGKNERIFSIIKFKSMNDRKDKDGYLLPDKDRLTGVGTYVRKTSLDELPQLINVLKGDMSFVGPRPLFTRYLPYYTEREKLRHSVKPGITGLAQISGRNKMKWDDRLELDVQYVLNCSFKLDMSILLRTVKKVLLKQDVVAVLDAKINVPLDIERQKQTL